MPLLIFHCRTRLFLAFVQQRAILGGAPTLTVPGRANEFHIDSPPNSVFKIIHLFKFKVKQIMLIKANYNQQMCSTSCSTDFLCYNKKRFLILRIFLELLSSKTLN